MFFYVASRTAGMGHIPFCIWNPHHSLSQRFGSRRFDLNDRPPSATFATACAPSSPAPDPPPPFLEFQSSALRRAEGAGVAWIPPAASPESLPAPAGRPERGGAVGGDGSGGGESVPGRARRRSRPRPPAQRLLPAGEPQAPRAVCRVHHHGVRRAPQSKELRDQQRTSGAQGDALPRARLLCAPSARTTEPNAGPDVYYFGSCSCGFFSECLFVVDALCSREFRKMKEFVSAQLVSEP